MPSIIKKLKQEILEYDIQISKYSYLFLFYMDLKFLVIVLYKLLKHMIDELWKLNTDIIEMIFTISVTYFNIIQLIYYFKLKYYWFG